MQQAFYYDSHSVNVPKEIAGLGWLVKSPGAKAIISPSFGPIDAIIDRIFEKASSAERNKIKQAHRLTDPRFGQIELCSAKKPMERLFSGNVFALYPDAKLLEQLEDYPNLKQVLVLPWMLKDHQAWVQKHHAQKMN